MKKEKLSIDEILIYSVIYRTVAVLIIMAVLEISFGINKKDIKKYPFELGQQVMVDYLGYGINKELCKIS